MNKKMNKKKYALSLLTFQPSELLIQLFADLYDNNHTNYSLFIIVDDNNHDISLYQKKYTYIQFIKISEEECYKYGYHNLNYLIKDGKPSAWEKATYFFAHKSLNTYDFVWFLEDDLFIPTSYTIYNIDLKYKDADLLSKKPHKVLKDWVPSKEVFKNSPIMYKKNLQHSMVCATRLSNKLLQIIDNYAKEYKKLFYVESFYHTLAHYHNLHIQSIPELSTIIFRKNWKIQYMNQDFIYHPVKSPSQQYSLRKFFQPNHTYILLQNVPSFYSMIQSKSKNKNKVNTYLSQIYAFQFTPNLIFKIIQKNNLYFIQNDQILPNNKVYSYSIPVNSWNDAFTYILNLQCTFLYYQTILVEEYRHNDTNISIYHYPGVFPILFIESYSHIKLQETFTELNISNKDLSSLQKIFHYTSSFFDTPLSTNSTLLFHKLHKSIKYIHKNINIYKKLVKEQKHLYLTFIKQQSNIKIRNNINFKFSNI